MKFTSAGIVAASSTSLSVIALQIHQPVAQTRYVENAVKPGVVAYVDGNISQVGTLTVTERRASTGNAISGLTVTGSATGRTMTFTTPSISGRGEHLGQANSAPIALSIVTQAPSPNAGSSATLTASAERTESRTVLANVSSSDEPVYDGTGMASTLVYQDNMEAYTTALAMGALPLGTSFRISPIPSPIQDGSPVDVTLNSVIAPGRDGTGKALRLSYTGAYQGSANWSTTNTPTTPTLATHYFQYYARVTFSGPIQNEVAVKWFEAWHPGVTRVQWNTHNRLPCQTGNAPTYWQVLDQAETTCQGNQPVGPYFENIVNQGWHRYTYAYRPNTSTGSRDGFARMWIDGVKMIDVSAATIGVTPPFGEKAWCLGDDVDNLATNQRIVYLRWGSTQTSITPSWTYDMDDVLWWIDP